MALLDHKFLMINKIGSLLKDCSDILRDYKLDPDQTDSIITIMEDLEDAKEKIENIS